jgi:alpha-N-acetylglucosaminidase
MAAADPSAIWLMQGWLFQSSWWTNRDIQAYLGGVPRGSMWLLDLFGDSNPIWSKTASYYGHPFIFCTLLNFGGQQGIVGNTPRVVTGFEAALANSTVNGVGITMEGIWTNYNMFELQLLLTWEGARFTPGTVAPKYDPVAYHAAYGHRKYGGVAHPSAVAAWALLGQVRHVFTHFSLRLDVWCAQTPDTDLPEGFWTREEEIEGLPTVFAKAAALAGLSAGRKR